MCLASDKLKTQSTADWRNSINILGSNNNNMQMANWQWFQEADFDSNKGKALKIKTLLKNTMR